jgi:hypothetical protein
MARTFDLPFPFEFVNQARSENVNIRVTPALHAALMDAARAENMPGSRFAMLAIAEKLITLGVQPGREPPP